MSRRVKDLEFALGACLTALRACHRVMDGAYEMDIVEEVSNETLNEAHRESWACIQRYSSWV